MSHISELPPDEYVVIETKLAMSDPATAWMLLHALDLALHPWGEPGVVPAVQSYGEYWATLPLRNNALRLVWMYVDHVSVAAMGSEATSYDLNEFRDITRADGWRFRPRWTPEPPE